MIAGNLMPVGNFFERFNKDVSDGLKDLERRYYGLSFTRETKPRMHHIISSFGERFSAQLLTALHCANNLKAATRMPHQIGLLTDDRYGDASADMTLATRGLHRHIHPTLKKRLSRLFQDFTASAAGGKSPLSAVAAAMTRPQPSLPSLTSGKTLMGS